MKLIINILILLLYTSSYSIIAQDKKNEINHCIKCHIENEIMPVKYQSFDIHISSGIGCQGCHGGDPNEEDQELSMSKKNGFIGIPSQSEIPELCGKCHSNINYMRIYRPRIATDQEAQYHKSQHGISLKKGNDNVATCINCHSSHQVLPASDPRSTVYPKNVPSMCNECHGSEEIMKPFNLATDQLSKYKNSVHGIALLEKNDIGSPACNDCHGNHGAFPPGVNSVSKICGTCHQNNEQFFNNSKMAQMFAGTDHSACIECHNYHQILKTNDRMIGIKEGSICIDCHTEGDQGYENAKIIGNTLEIFSEKYDLLNKKIHEVDQKGMDIIDLEFNSKEIHHKLIETRTLIHTFDSNLIKEKTNEAERLIKETNELADQEIENYKTRRNGLGFATILFIILAIAIYLKIKELDTRRKTSVIDS